jgi:hypothetical protein
MNVVGDEQSAGRCIGSLSGWSGVPLPAGSLRICLPKHDGEAEMDTDSMAALAVHENMFQPDVLREVDPFRLDCVGWPFRPTRSLLVSSFDRTVRISLVRTFG